MIKTPLRGRKDPLKFASLPTCGFVAQLVERPTSIWEARVQAPSKPEFFSGFFFCNFFNWGLPARINSSLINRRSNMIYFIYYLWQHIIIVKCVCKEWHCTWKKTYFFNKIQAFPIVHPVNICPLQALPKDKKKALSYKYINPLLTKLVRSRWLDIGQVRFFFVFCFFCLRFYNLWSSTLSRSKKNAKKKNNNNEVNIQPSWSNLHKEFRFWGNKAGNPELAR